MAENDRIEFPEEVKETKSNSIEEPEEGSKVVVVEQNRSAGVPQVAMRNMIQTPGNCPPGYMMDAEGKCREVF